MVVRPCIVRLRAVRAKGQPQVHSERRPLVFVCFEKLTAWLLLCRLVSGLRCLPACVSQHAGTCACKMAHNAVFDIASLVLDGGAIVKSSVGAVALVFNSV